jgi:hypothetical protein
MNWITIVSFTFPHEAYVITAKLESEGIRVNLKDELTTQVNNFYSNAIGGVKVQVSEDDYSKAREILIEADLMEQHSSDEESGIAKFNRVSSKWPFLGKIRFEYRIAIIASAISVIFALLMIF